MLFARLAHRVTSLWDRQALRKKLSFCLVCMTVCPLLLTMAITEYKSEKTLTRLVVDHNRDLAEHTAEDVDQMFSEKMKVLRFAATTVAMKSMLPNQQLPLLKAIAEADADILIVTVADIDGKQISRSDNQADMSINYGDREYFQTIQRTGEEVLSNVLISKSTGYPGIVIAEPIKDENQQLTGVLIATVELRAIIDRITQIKVGQTGYAFLVNHEGRILLHPNRGMVERGEDVSQLAPVKLVLDKQTGSVEYRFGGQKSLAAFSYIPQTGWGLIVQQSAEDALADVSAVKQTAIMIAIMAAGLAAIIGLVVAGMMVKPITAISRAADRLAKGNMYASCQVSTQDEIGKLATTFNFMASELRTRATELWESEEKYRSLVENISIGIYRRETGAASSFIVYANPALVSMLGYDTVEELLAIPLPDNFWSWEESAAIKDAIEQNGSVKNREVQLRRKDGTAIWCSITAVNHYNHKIGNFCVDGVVKDITERKLADERLRQAHAELERKVAERTKELTILNEELCLISMQDSLTCIANRRNFDEVLGREWQRAKREQTSIALILLDVDFFKLYNDTYGHVAGDECLRQIGNTLKKIAKRATDLVARYGGEEFAVILPDTDQAGAVKVGERILASVRELGIRHDMSLANEVVTVSLGIAVAEPAADVMPDRIIVAADRALYQAKQSGRNQLQLAPSLVDDNIFTPSSIS